MTIKCFQCNLLCYINISLEVYAQVKEESYHQCSLLGFSISIVNIIIRLLTLPFETNCSKYFLSIFLLLKIYLSTKSNRCLLMAEDINDHHIAEYYHH